MRKASENRCATTIFDSSDFANHIGRNATDVADVEFLKIDPAASAAANSAHSTVQSVDPSYLHLRHRARIHEMPRLPANPQLGPWCCPRGMTLPSVMSTDAMRCRQDSHLQLPQSEVEAVEFVGGEILAGGHDVPVNHGARAPTGLRHQPGFAAPGAKPTHGRGVPQLMQVKSVDTAGDSTCTQRLSQSPVGQRAATGQP